MKNGSLRGIMENKWGFLYYVVGLEICGEIVREVEVLEWIWYSLGY